MDVNHLEHTLNRMSAGQKNRVAGLLAALEEGRITVVEFVETVATSVLTANARAYALGAAVARGLIERKVGEVELTPVRGSRHHMDEPRITGAIATILAADEERLVALLRLVDNEPKSAAVDGSSDVLRASGHVTGYRRVLDSGACELCQWLHKGGYVYPADQPMHRHPGCVCAQEPVTTR